MPSADGVRRQDPLIVDADAPTWTPPRTPPSGAACPLPARHRGRRAGLRRRRGRRALPREGTC
ncbi:hypothetical protein HBB16_14765 [Pseudonocardia sp. MCCB 268]|nr:hypothetical protein [Pseudonocardia cytotoxica]